MTSRTILDDNPSAITGDRRRAAVRPATDWELLSVSDLNLWRKAELREQLYAERIAIGTEQYRQAQRLEQIRGLLYELEDEGRDG